MTATYDTYPAYLPMEQGSAFEGVSRKEAGSIGFFPFLDSVNVYQELADRGETLPAEMKQWRSIVDFHRAVLNVNLMTNDGVKGVRRFDVVVELMSEPSPTARSAVIDDVGPATEWKASGISGDGTIKLSYDIVGNLLKLVGIGGAGLVPGGETSFTFAWNPKVGAVISGTEGLKARWSFTRTDGAYLDGDHQLMILIRRPRDTSSMTIRIHEARVDFDLGWKRAETVVIGMKDIPVNFIESPQTA